MQKLTEAIEEFRDDPGSTGAAGQLTEAAAEWASFSILHFSGDVLDLALEVAKAIGKFTERFERIEAQKTEKI